MQEVCSVLETQMGTQIKSESPLNALSITPSQTIIPPVTAVPQPTAAMIVNKMGPTCDKRTPNETPYWMASEGGFINSQPSMAEFLNHLSPESPKIVGGTNLANYSIGSMPQTPDGIDSVPEYPWMKEKKTSRKNSNNNQGEFDKDFS